MVGLTNTYLDQLGQATCPFWTGVWSCDRLKAMCKGQNKKKKSTKALACIVNLAPSSQPLGHFVALFYNQNRWKVFDPVGFLAIQNNQFIDTFLNKHRNDNNPACYLTHPVIQHDQSQFCGFYCLALLLAVFRENITIQDFYQLFLPFPSLDNDDIVKRYLIHVLKTTMK